MAVERKYLYKVYKDGAYLGLLPNVTSEFEYSQSINTGSTEINVTIANLIDTSQESVEPIETEDGQPLQAEDGATITTERSTEIISSATSGAIVANNNDVYIYEVSDYDTNGTLVFSGYISRWQSTLSSQGSRTTITILSYGKDLDDYIYGNETLVAQITQTTQIDADQLTPTQQAAQTFTPGSSYSILKVKLRLAYKTIPITATVSIYSGTPHSGVLLDSASVSVTNLFPTMAEYEILFPAGVSVTSGGAYYIHLSMNTNGYYSFNYNGADAYTGGTLYSNSSGSWAVYSGVTNPDMYFVVYSGSLLTDAIYTATDPSVMVRDALDGYASQGGVATYTTLTVPLTGYSLNYTFSLNTILEQIEKARELSPADWYWYVDVASQVLYFKSTATTATHSFILGRHLDEFEVEASVEGIINVVYFTGGPTAGVNLLKKYTDTASLLVNRTGMRRLNDNKILAANVSAAQTIAESLEEENDSEEYRSEVTIHAETYDIDTIKLGDTVAIQGFANFIDRTVFQVTRVRRGGSYATLTLGKLPLVSSSYVDKIKRELDSVQTLDNPTAPV